jgi:hypothetical protein
MWHPSNDPFLRPDSARYDDILADGVVHLLRTSGVDGLSVRALARWMKVTPSAVTQRAGRADSIVLIARALGQRWLQWSARQLVLGAPGPPSSEAEAHGVRVWHLVAELARTEAAAGRRAAAEVIDDVWARERAVLFAWWQRDAGSGTQPAGRRDTDFETFWFQVQAERLARGCGIERLGTGASGFAPN